MKHQYYCHHCNAARIRSQLAKFPETQNPESYNQCQDSHPCVVTASPGDADGRFKEAIAFYEPLVQGHLENLLEVTAIVLANLCVCYIMTSQNDQAEALMRQVERQEEQQALAVRTVPHPFSYCRPVFNKCERGLRRPVCVCDMRPCG